MKTLTKIIPKTDRIIRRVAAYCRVSTDSDEQLESLDTQIRHYESRIKTNPDWEYAGIYYDEGISGTKKEKRPELLRLILDCENGLIDYILTKSISRFARNTTDCLEIVRKLQSLEVYIYFEKENIDTGNMQDELMLTILSELAESESKSISHNSRWSIKRRFLNGTYKFSSPPFGFDSIDGTLVVNEKEAEIVRLIFYNLLSGKGSEKIAKELNTKGFRTRKNLLWNPSSILNIISNEKYVGDVLFQKTYMDENFNHRVNNGEREQYYLKNHHAVIISRDDFETAQALVKQRAKVKGADTRRTPTTSRYPFSGKLLCENCGATLKRRIHHQYIAWCCKTHLLDNAKCPLKFIRDTALQHSFVAMMNKLIVKPCFFEDKNIEEINRKLLENAEQQKVLIGLMTKGYLESAVYIKRNNELMQEAKRMRKQKASLLLSLDSENALIQYISKAEILNEFNEEVFKRFVTKIHVYSREEVGFELKCGITVKEKL